MQNDDAPIALQMARDIENKHNTNIAKVQHSMAELEWYKKRSGEKEDDITYSDSFKKRDRKEIEANLRMVKLALFWDNSIEMCEKHDLPVITSPIISGYILAVLTVTADK